MSNSFTVAVTGQSLIKQDTRGISSPGFQEVRSILENADLAFTNFEGTIAGRYGGWPLKGSFFDCSKPVVLDALQDIGFQALSLSNNHAFDLGPSGILSTLEEVRQRGFLHAGTGRNYQEAVKPGVDWIGQRKVAIIAMDGGPGPDFMYADDAGEERPERPGVNRLGISQLIDVDEPTFDALRSVRDKVGYTQLALTNDSQPNDPYPVNELEEVCIGRAVFRRSEDFRRSVKINDRDLAVNLEAIRDASAQGCLVIAYLHHHHWATDWLQVPDWVRGVAKQCIDAGAAAFVSHGAPVLQGMEIYRKRPIFYSLGNFIFHVPEEEGTWRAPEVWESVIGTCCFDEDNNLTDVALHPVIIGGEQALAGAKFEHRLVPELVRQQNANRILKQLADRSSVFGTSIEISNDCGRVRL
ncbi:capsule biosynthesis protein CapA [Ochrobactrum sp. 695/2009]|uniref:CapA family protein n=1 Tax=Brucella intermedia TaxID=94625 RepID=A0A7V6PDV9_9HYPH|nr:CapA family protein [Brucella intermedia]PJR92409.1 capsule biosynthesis protein CapA [Ochrobactrum sp. 721/2009]PJT15767.1 capsule biosynthesis protein CapA [Ochrobactrum sp. 720/2009]PJT18373.1 capsule biosynthesis protein CapA [Ochrobactrum sp. 715/2009]PJT24015.1 capsule biosynthesis protein CapA [Ochrobactrum sp. 695/2009]PJT33546.1 capsule biosynthesis protein CapA [Ochrobactrum sp. 689/2009]